MFVWVCTRLCSLYRSKDIICNFIVCMGVCMSVCQSLYESDWWKVLTNRTFYSSTVCSVLSLVLT